jgi:hypothetical protein
LREVRGTRLKTSVLNAVVNTRYLILIVTILMLVAYSTSCAADSARDGDYASLIDNLRKAGAVVEPRGEVSPDFLSGKRSVMSLNGSNVQVWEYEDEAAADVEAAFISTDGFSVRTDTKITLAEWIAPPHFYKAGKLIVLYVGESEAITVVLERVLGPQFAGPVISSGGLSSL